MEIEEIEKEVSPLSSKLEAIRLEKAEYCARSIAMRGRDVPAKFMEPKQSIKNLETAFMKHEFITPIQSIQSRRKSCFFKLQDIDEGRVTRERGKSLSLSPKSRKTVYKALQRWRKTSIGKETIETWRAVGSRYNQIPNQSNNEKSENRMKKKWEIPSEVIILKEESPQSIGPAKRVAELMGRKPYFSMEEETENSVRQALSLAEGDGEKK
ncbi:hypothetical protein F3Y22_tig00117040pilonHSYRG00074 [Hibiscus syriacus]|uniref:Uncharacterized protein n=1 Tax=Hibiscus syriacus TaxID=106335 RepID=A0A6A2WMH3_HIBSY|nr:hypothetical protein F3Y22_tig00117040pilonHSYRG00074 [Hibiscus syriacus]